MTFILRTFCIVVLAGALSGCSGDGSSTRPFETAAQNPPGSVDAMPLARERAAGPMAFDGQPIGTTFFARNALARSISANPPFDPQSAGMVAAITSGNSGVLQFSTTGASGTVVSTGHASDTSYAVRCLEPWGRCAATRARVPDGTQSGSAGDFHNAFIDGTNGTETDSWLTCASGSGNDIHGNPCTFPLMSRTLQIGWGGSGSMSADGTGFGATATSIALTAGVVRPEDLLAGRMTHGVSIAVQCVQADTFVYPATGGSGQGSATCTGAKAVPRYGQILWLDGTGESKLLAINPVALQPYIRAMHDYGFYLTDLDQGSPAPAGTVPFAANVESNPNWLAVVNSIKNDPHAVDTSISNGSYHIMPRIFPGIENDLHVLDASCSIGGC